MVLLVLLLLLIYVLLGSATIQNRKFKKLNITCM